MRSQSTSPLGRFVAILLAVTLYSAPAAFAAPKGGKPGGGGGGGSAEPCVEFDNLVIGGGGIGGDASGAYCNDRKAKVLVEFSPDGHFHLDTNNSNKTGAGRSLLIDFGEPIMVTDSDGTPHTFTSTADLDAEEIDHDAGLHVGAFESSFDMFSMAPGESRDVNLTCTLFVHFSGSLETPIFIKLAPNPLDNGRYCEVSDPVTIECQGRDVNGDCNTWTVTAAGATACVSEEPFDTNTIGHRTLSTSMTISSGVPSAQGQGGGGSFDEPLHFVRGDADFDGGVDLADALSTLGYLFTSGPALPCAEAADSDDDGAVSLADAVFTLGFLFSGGPAFPAPYPDPGEDPTADALGCQ